MDDIMIIGGGGHGVAVFEVLAEHPDYNVVGYFDHIATNAMSLLPIDYLGTDDDLFNPLETPQLLAIGLGQIKSPKPRIKVFEKLFHRGAKFPNIISTKAVVSSYSEIRSGSIIFHNALVNAGCQIGACNIINSASVIEHGVQTEDFVHIAPGAIILGNAKIGHGSFVGAGSIIREGVTVGANCIVGAGVTVRHDIKDGAVIAT